MFLLGRWWWSRGTDVVLKGMGGVQKRKEARVRVKLKRETGG